MVEVKSGESDGVRPEVHVNPAKQRKLAALAAQLVRRYGLQSRTIRFDVVGVVWPAGARRAQRSSDGLGIS